MAFDIYQDWSRIIETGAPLPGATITVFNAGTAVKPLIYEDAAAATPLANPFTSDAVTGVFAFYANNGLYDVQVVKVGATTYTLSDVKLHELTAFRRAAVTLTQAQLIALDTTPVVLIAAPGAGIRIQPWFASLVADTRNAAYTNIDVDAILRVRTADQTEEVLTAVTNGNSTGQTAVTDLLAAIARRTTQLLPFSYDGLAAAAGYLAGSGLPAPAYDPNAASNQALRIDLANGAAGNLTGGDPANTLQVVVYYTLETIPA